MKRGKAYIHKCSKCGGQTMYGHKPDPMIYPEQFLCLEDECLWTLYDHPDI